MDSYIDQKPPKCGKISPADSRRLKPYTGVPECKPYKCTLCSYATTDHGRLLSHSLHRCTRNPKKPRESLTLSKTYNSEKLLVPISLVPGVRIRSGSRIFNSVNTSTNSQSSRTESSEGERRDLDSRSVSKATSQVSINESVIESNDVVLNTLIPKTVPNCALQPIKKRRRLRIVRPLPEKETSQAEKEAEKMADLNAPINVE